MIRALLDLYILVIIADFIIAFFPSFKYQNWAKTIHKMSEFSCRPVRQALPPNIAIDPSPFIVILAINILKLLW